MRINPFRDANLYDLEDNIQSFVTKQSKSFRGRIFSFFSGIRKKGNEKITLMFIPHSEKRIVNFHISIFSIIFFLSFVITVVTATTIMIVNHTSTIKEIARLKLYGYDTRVQIEHYQNEINGLYDTFQQFKPELTYLYSLTPNSYVDSLWAKGGPSPSESNSAAAAAGSEAVPAPDLEELNVTEMEQELKTTKEVLKKIKVFLANRKKIIENTPSIWPTDGYITANYGNRTSPRTNQSEFASGVDIETFPGAEIRATAPGTVESITWDDEKGLSIKLRHKYGFATIYSHCQRVSVKEEQKVTKGETIGYVGKTGDAMKNKLFYQIQIGMEFVDPAPYLNKLYRSTK